MRFVMSVVVAMGIVFVGVMRQPRAQTVEVSLVLAGLLSCTNSSIANAGTYAVIPGATVEFVCGIWILERVVKSTSTTRAGIYTFAFGATEILLTNPEFCHLRATLPASSCTFDPPGGVLSFPIIGIRSSSGNLIHYIPGSPTYLPI